MCIILASEASQKNRIIKIKTFGHPLLPTKHHPHKTPPLTNLKGRGADLSESAHEKRECFDNAFILPFY